MASAAVVLNPSRRQSISEDSSFELSFEYQVDEHGQPIRVSTRGDVDKITPPTPLSTVPTNTSFTDDQDTMKELLPVPRRSSLSRSESAPNPEASAREWKRTVSTPVGLMAALKIRSHSTNSIGTHQATTEDKENEEIGIIPSKTTPYHSSSLTRPQAPLPVRAARGVTTQTVTPGPTAPLRSKSFRSTTTTPVSSLSRRAPPPAELSLVIESGGESDVAVEIETEPEDEPANADAGPSSPPIVTRNPTYGHARARGDSVVGSATPLMRDTRPRRYTNESRLSDTPMALEDSTPAVYSRGSSLDSTDPSPSPPPPVPPIPPRAQARSRSVHLTTGLPTPTATVMPLSTRAGGARRITLEEKKRMEKPKDDDPIDPETVPIPEYQTPSPEGSPTGQPQHYISHQRTESQTVLPPSHPSNQPNTSTVTLLTSESASAIAAPIPTSSRLSPSAQAMSKHRRSPTAPDPPTSSTALGGSGERVGKTWGGSTLVEEDGEERERDRDMRDRDRNDRERAAAANVAASGIGTSQRHFVVNRKTYIRLDLLGKGGSSRVYRVMTPQNYEFYALKRVSLDKVSDEEMAGYRNEINLLRRLSGNERIIRLVDAELKVGGGGSKGSLMLVMECGEIDLAHLLQSTQTEKLDWISIMGWWKQMLQAVHVIHEEKIVHSDLKPANFVLVKGKLKLIDFGIANAIANDTTNIQRDHQIGTVNYMSPEAIELPEGMRRLKVGRSSDVWSLGCILYQMIYGQPPFAALSTLGKMKAIPDAEHAIDFPSESSPFRPPSSSSSSSPSQQCRPTERDTSDEKKSFVPPAVIETMKACLKRNPKERAEIPELLAASWLSVGVAPSPPPPPPPPPVALNAAECSHPSWTLLKLHQAPIDAHLMSQALQYAIQHGKNDPQWIQDQGPKLIAELQKLAKST